MAVISQAIGKDLLDMYDGFDSTKVGIGMMNPNIYATQAYQKKKIQNMIIGGVSDVIYSGHEHDRFPKILTVAYEPQYNTVIGVNLNYLPPDYRKNVLKFILETNKARIKSNVPLVINFDSLRKIVPQVNGAIRRYKVVGIRVNKTYQLNEWPEIVNESSKWQNHWKLGVKK